MAWLPRAPGGWRRVVLPVVFVGVAVFLRLVVFASLGTRNPFVTFYPAILLSALVGGLLPGIAATGASAAVVHLLIDGGNADGSRASLLVLFGVFGILVSVIGEAFRRSRAEVEATNETLRREVEEHRRAEAEAKASGERVSGILANMQDVYLRADLEGRIVYASPSAARAFGYAGVDEMVGLPAASLYGDPGDRERLVEDLASTGEIRDRVLQGHRRDGTAFWISMNVRLVRDGEGRLAGTEGVLRDTSERRVAEEKLREAEGRYRRIVETAQEGIWQIDADARTTYVNPRMEEILGYAPGEMDGRSIYDFVPAPDRARAAAEVTASGQAPGDKRELRLLRKDGTEILASMSTTPLLSPDGTRVGGLGMVSDITERRRAEEAVRRNERFLSDLIENSGAVIFVKDRAGRFELVNRKWTEVTGIGAGDAIGRTAVDLFPPETALQFQSGDLAALESGRPVELEETMGEGAARRHFLTVKFPVFAEDGSIRGVCGMTTDATDRMVALERLSESERKLRVVAENTDAWEFWVDPGGTYVYCSPSCERLTGHRPDEFVADRGLLSRIAHPDDRDALVEHRRLRLSTAASGGPWRDTEEIEFRVLLPDGTTRWLGHRCSSIVDEEGRFLGSRGSNRDITRRKEAEAEARRLTDELESRVALRTRELAAALDELEGFTYSVSHDLRAPVRAIDGFAKLLGEHLGEALDAEGQRLLATVTRNAERTGVLIDDLVALHRLSRREVALAPVSMTRAAREALAEVIRPEARDRIRVAVADLPLAEADPELVRTVWVNLVSNAVKFSRGRGIPEIEIGSRRGAEGVEYFVRDNGVGFDPSYAGRLFGMFQRLHTQAEFEGRGIGLALVRRIVEKHAGRAWAEGTVGKGATFWFSLPGAVDAAPTAPPPTRA